MGRSAHYALRLLNAPFSAKGVEVRGFADGGGRDSARRPRSVLKVLNAK
jgi:hypothetical protein